MKLEEALEEARRAGSSIPDQLQQAILLKCVSGQLRTHLNLAIQESTTFKELREQVLRWDRSQQKWSNLIFDDASGSTPMEVDRVYADGRSWSSGGKKGDKGKGKGGSSKGNQSQKGKGKGKTKTKMVKVDQKGSSRKVIQAAKAVGSKAFQGKAKATDQTSLAISVVSMATMPVIAGELQCDRFKMRFQLVHSLASRLQWQLAHHLRQQVHRCLLPLSMVVLQEFNLQMHMSQMFQNMMS